jgi:hypothetical protein
MLARLPVNPATSILTTGEGPRWGDARGNALREVGRTADLTIRRLRRHRPGASRQHRAHGNDAADQRRYQTTPRGREGLTHRQPSPSADEVVGSGHHIAEVVHPLQAATAASHDPGPLNCSARAANSV